MSVPTTRSLLLSLAAIASITAPLADSQAATVAQFRAQARAAKRLEQRQVRGSFDAQARSSRIDELRKKLDDRRTSRNAPSTDKPSTEKPAPTKEQPTKQPTAEKPAPTPVDSSIGSVRQQILDLVNAERKKAGLGSVSQESHLQSAAQKHAEDMSKRNYFEHNTPEGKTPTQQIKDAGYPLTGKWTTGQNIARGQKTAEQVMEDWMNSPGHKKNILNGSFEHLGVGYVSSGNYWVQDFGSHQ